MAKVPPKHKKHYFKAVTGLYMREEGSLELEDEHCREEVKEIFRDQKHKREQHRGFASEDDLPIIRVEECESHHLPTPPLPEEAAFPITSCIPQ